MDDRIPCGGLLEKARQCLVKVHGFAWRPGESCGVLSLFGAGAIPLSFLNIGTGDDDLLSMTLCFGADRLPQARPLVGRIEALFRPRSVTVVEDVTILTVYGPHFGEKHALASEAFSALCRESVRVLAVCSSINSISIVVTGDEAAPARRSLAARFAWPE
jgi:Aspartokinases